MIPAGLVNALVARSRADATYRANLRTEWETLTDAFLDGGKARQTMNSASANGKSFTFNSDLTKDEKITVLTSVLTELGNITAGAPSVTYGTFDQIRR